MLGIAIEGISVRLSGAVQPFFLSARRVQIQRRETIFLIIKDISLAVYFGSTEKNESEKETLQGNTPGGRATTDNIMRQFEENRT